MNNTAVKLMLGFACLGAMFFLCFAAAEEAGISTQPSSKIKPSVTCQIEGGAQVFSTEQRIVNVSFRRCNFRESELGVPSATLELSIMFFADANISKCQNLSLSFLFDVSVSAEGLSLPVEHLFVDDVTVLNVAGQQQSIKMFSLHKGSSRENILFSDVVGGAGSLINFVDHYWGEIQLIDDVPDGEFDQLLNEAIHLEQAGATAQVNKPVSISVGIFPPRGLCLWQDESDQSRLQSLFLQFSNTGGR